MGSTMSSDVVLRAGVPGVDEGVVAHERTAVMESKR